MAMFKTEPSSGRHPTETATDEKARRDPYPIESSDIQFFLTTTNKYKSRRQLLVPESSLMALSIYCLVDMQTSKRHSGKMVSHSSSGIYDFVMMSMKTCIHDTKTMSDNVDQGAQTALASQYIDEPWLASQDGWPCMRCI